MHSIRQANLSDIPSLAKLELLVFGQGGHTPVSLRQIIDLFPSLVVVAENDNHRDSIIGYSIGAISQDRIGWILALASHQNYRKLGLGRSLTKSVVARLEQLNAKEVLLTVAPNNTCAKSLYEKLGFCERGVIDNYFFDGDPRVLMALTNEP